MNEVPRPLVQYAEIQYDFGNQPICGITEDDDGNVSPALYDTYEQAMSDQHTMQDEWKSQIAAGERDADDFWESEIWPCHVYGDYIILLDRDNLTEVTRFDWESAHGL